MNFSNKYEVTKMDSLRQRGILRQRGREAKRKQRVVNYLILFYFSPVKKILFVAMNIYSYMIDKEAFSNKSIATGFSLWIKI